MLLLCFVAMMAASLPTDTTVRGELRAKAVADSTHPAPAPALVPLRPRLGTFQFVVLQRVSGDSIFRPFGRLIVRRERLRADSRTMVRNVAHYEWVNGKTTTDTTLSLTATLAPLSERTHTPSRIVAYDFQGLHAAGQIGPADSLAPIDDTLPRPAFNSTDLDMLVTALPLDSHFHASIPLYDPEFPGFRRAELRVTGSEAIAIKGKRRQAWILAVDQPSRPTLYYRIDARSRLMLRKDYGGPKGPQFRVESR